MAESSIEIPSAPAWLSKLENRREILSKSKIGHETGAGASCNVCGDGCPGLDLHFWRKLCRNCKCRKDQHDVPDEDLSGWAQFEILGAIRSKPAYLKIKALENQVVHLDWVPPNVSPEMAVEYMNQLGENQIPITGSAAALHRKQQLEYQVPPHDLDPDLCHNLTNSEKKLFEEHVSRVMCNSGQGYVTRLGVQKALTNYVSDPKNTPGLNFEKNILKTQSELPKSIIENIKKDKILQQILCSELVRGVKHGNRQDDLINQNHYDNKLSYGKPDFLDSPLLSLETKDKLIPMKINSQAIQSAVLHGWFYDNLINDLDHNKVNYSKDLLLNPIKMFRDEYNRNEPFKNEMGNYAIELGGDILAPISDIGTNNFDNRKSGQSDISVPNIDKENKEENKIPKINYSNHPLLAKKDLRDNKPNIDSILDQFKPNQMIDLDRKTENYLPEINLKDLHISSQENIPSILCYSCKLQIHQNDVVVQTDKNGKQVAWHPKCFVCFSCNELLADLVYFTHKGKIYCARDFAAILKIPRCKACDELIFTKEYTVAEGASFHVKHFCCFHCDIPLADQSYVIDEKSNQPLCLPCYENYQAEKCQSCKKPICANEQGVAWGSLHWHTYCFNCAGKKCNKSLLGGRFMVKNDMPLCSTQCFASLSN